MNKLHKFHTDECKDQQCQLVGTCRVFDLKDRYNSACIDIDSLEKQVDRCWWMLWDMFWGWLGAEIHLDILMGLCEKHKIGAK